MILMPNFVRTESLRRAVMPGILRRDVEGTEEQRDDFCQLDATLDGVGDLQQGLTLVKALKRASDRFTTRMCA
jgi:hypothetical protein